MNWGGSTYLNMKIKFGREYRLSLHTGVMVRVRMVDSVVTVSGDLFKFFTTLAANLFRLLPFWNRLRVVQ